jgi:hypothetical protein
MEQSLLAKRLGDSVRFYEGIQYCKGNHEDEKWKPCCRELSLRYCS